MPIRNALLLLPILWLPFWVRAQDIPQIRNFKPTDYLGQNQNWSLVQGREGWLYAANNGGLLAFDGVRWETHYLPEKQTLRTLATDAEGRVFCGAFAEFGYWKTGANGQLEYTSLSATLSPNQLGKEEIWHILVRPGEVLFQSFSLIYKYDYQSIVVIKPPASIMFAHEVNGRVLVPVIGQGLYELQAEGNFRELPSTHILKDKIVQFVTTGPKGDPWVGTANDGIYVLQNQLCKPLQHPLNEVFKRAQLNRALPLSRGGMAIGTIREGVLILDREGELRHQLSRKNGLQNNTVLALHEDRIGNLWIGLDKGIDLAELRSPLAFFSDQSGQIGTVYCAAEHEGLLYIGANQGVFYRPLNGREFSMVAGTQGQAWDLQVFDNQLICGHNSGTFLLKNGKAQKISSITGGWHTLRVPAYDNLLLQCTYTGLILFSRQGNSAWRFVHKLSGFTGPLKRILFDDNGILWGVHPNRGLFRFKVDSLFSSVLQFDYFEKGNGLAADYQLDLCKIGSNLIVQGPTKAQMVRDNGAEVHFMNWKAPRQARKWLPVETNLFFMDDNGLNLWLPETAMSIGVDLVPNFEKIVPLSNERFLFCLENGFATMNMNQFLAQARPANNFQVQLRLLETADGKSFGKQPDLVLSYAQNSLKLLFTVSDFVPSPRFSWYLEGFSNAWSEPQYLAEKEFTNLPEGEYTFRVRSGPSEDSFSFRILPPWYRSAWAFLVYFLLTVFLFWSIERYNRYRLARLKHRLEQEKEHELLVLEVDNKNRELSNAAFNLIRKNETLQGLKEELAETPKDHRSLDKIIRQIDAHLDSDHDWQVFEEAFNRAHDDFFKRLMHDYPELTPGDLRLAAYLKMNLSSKEIAPLLNISIRGVENKRYRLRKKLGLPEDANLAEFIIGY